MFCKVKANFSNYQIFSRKIFDFFETARLFSRSFASLSASAVVSFSKASAKLQHSPETTKYFAKNFSANFTTFYSIRYTSTN